MYQTHRQTHEKAWHGQGEPQEAPCKSFSSTINHSMVCCGLSIQLILSKQAMCIRLQSDVYSHCNFPMNLWSSWVPHQQNSLTLLWPMFMPYFETIFKQHLEKHRKDRYNWIEFVFLVSCSQHEAKRKSSHLHKLATVWALCLIPECSRIYPVHQPYFKMWTKPSYP